MVRNLFQLRHLSKTFGPGADVVLDDVSLDIPEGECLALIGESGSGKTTLGKCLLRLIPVDRGKLIHRDLDLFQLSERQFRPFRTKFQMVFQSSAQALNPRQTAGACISEPIRVHRAASARDARDKALELLDAVGLGADLYERFPDELSGGQRQRVAIARALAVDPVFLVADEPTSSLDAQNKQQIIDLLRDLRQELGLTLLLITHDLRMVQAAAGRIAVIYRGELVEIASTRAILRKPAHPYTRLLFESSIRGLDLVAARAEGFTEHSRRKRSAGCCFADRCPIANPVCLVEKPRLHQCSTDQHAACHLPGAQTKAQSLEATAIRS